MAKAPEILTCRYRFGFASPIVGFAWNPNVAGVPLLYATIDSGRSWTWSAPRLAP